LRKKFSFDEVDDLLTDRTKNMTKMLLKTCNEQILFFD